MKVFNRNISFAQLQWCTWIFISGIIFSFLLHYQSILGASVIAVESTVFYALILYGNASFLIPRLYWKGRKVLYVVVSIIFLIVVTVGRLWCEYLASNYFLKGEKMPSNHAGAFFYDLFYDILIFIVGIIFRLSLDYFRISKQQEELKKRTAEAELNLLKSQVQPHFLFNTLNNLYALTLKKSDLAPETVLKLSNIMEYMIYESNETMVPLEKEIKYLKDYIDLERLRQSQKTTINFEVNGHVNGQQIAPLLLLPFVEKCSAA